MPRRKSVKRVSRGRRNSMRRKSMKRKSMRRKSMRRKSMRRNTKRVNRRKRSSIRMRGGSYKTPLFVKVAQSKNYPETYKAEIFDHDPRQSAVLANLSDNDPEAAVLTAAAAAAARPRRRGPAAPAEPEVEGEGNEQANDPELGVRAEAALRPARVFTNVRDAVLQPAPEEAEQDEEALRLPPATPATISEHVVTPQGSRQREHVVTPPGSRYAVTPVSTPGHEAASSEKKDQWTQQLIEERRRRLSANTSNIV